MEKEAFLLNAKKKGYSPAFLEQLKVALELAHAEFSPKKRLVGDSYFEHNLRVAEILLENKAEPEVLLAGLLHGDLTVALKEKVQHLFGQEVLGLIEGMAEVKKIKNKNEQLEAEALRKILLTTIEDVRVLVLKLANKLDNLRSLGVLSKKEQIHLAQEVLEVYAPLAYRLGLEKIRIPLEDLAFKTLQPEKYEKIASFLEESQVEREKEIEETLKIIKRIVANQLPLLKIKGRPKHIYSISKKLEQKNLQLNDLFDLLGIRIIVPEVKDCYTLLGLLHENFEPVEGRLKDYIANPKPNFYRSIHTGLKLPNGKILEVQIRTPEMDEAAEEGLAAHWQYKNLSSEEKFEKKVAWLKGILDLQKDSRGKEFLEAAKVDVFGDKIYCYTPKGDVKELPKGSTVLDFAYFVHAEVGDKAVGARVNGKFVPLRQTLAKGDVIEILTNKKQRPRRDWLKIVKTARAKQKIKKSLQEHEKGPTLRYRLIQPSLSEEEGLLVESKDFPKAICLLAKCCSPLPGEEIIGLVTKRRIVSVHQKECRIVQKEIKRGVKVNWRNSFAQKIRFFVDAEERSGLLADLLHTIASAKFEVKEAKAKIVGKDHAQCSFLVIPRDLEHLKELVKRVKKLKGIQRIYFE